jgi:hypothetical protein
VHGHHQVVPKAVTVSPKVLGAASGRDPSFLSFRCHGPLFWPMMVAALIKPDLWISLRQD